MSSKPKMTKDTIPENFTLSLALVHIHFIHTEKVLETRTVGRYNVCERPFAFLTWKKNE